MTRIGPQLNLKDKVTKTHFQNWIAGETSQTEIALEVGCDQSYICTIFKRMLHDLNIKP